MSASGTTEAPNLSAECTVGNLPDYTDMHGRCRQTKDISLPHGTGVLYQARCRCTCHARAGDAS